MTGGLVVLVVRRDRLQPVELDQLGSLGQQIGCRPQEPGVVGAGPKAPGETQDLHDAYAWTNSSSTASVTSLASAKPPLGSGAFQFMSYAVRSTVASSAMPVLT